MSSSNVQVKQEPAESARGRPDSAVVPAIPKNGRKRRAKTPARRMPIYSLGSELSVDERLQRFNAETEVEFGRMREFCKTMSKTLQKERERVRSRDDSPERKKQDQFIGSIKHKVDSISRRLGAMHEDLVLRNAELQLECEVERARMLVEREQRGKINMHWARAGGLITTPHQRRLQESAVKAEENAAQILELEAKAEQPG